MFDLDFVSLPGSDIQKIKGDKKKGNVPDQELIDFFVYIRPEEKEDTQQTVSYSAADLFLRIPPQMANEDEYQAVLKWGTESNFQRKTPDVVGWKQGDDQDRFERASKKIRFSAKADDINQAFKIKLIEKTSDEGDFRTYAGSIKVPEELGEVILNVTGLDQTPSDGSHKSLEYADFDRKKVEDLVANNFKDFVGEDPDDVSLFQDFQWFIDVEDATIQYGDNNRPKFGDFLKRLRKNFPKTALELFYSKKLQKRLLDSGIPFKYAHLATEVTDFYNFPKDFEGKDQTIGIISLDGGWKSADLEKFFYDHGISPTLENGKKRVIVYSVDGGDGEYKDDEKYLTYNLENTLDICIAAAAAPQARIVVYCANNGLGPRFYESYIQAISAAVNDEFYRPSVVSMSFSDTELSWGPDQIRRMNALFFEGAKKGMTFCASAGNFGSKGSSIQIKKETEVRFPGSSPYVMCCGGLTTLSHGLPENSRILEERVFNDPTYQVEDTESPFAGGGGYSRVFVQPKWQKGKDLPKSVNGYRHFPMRALPDVSANAAMLTGYPIYLDGDIYPVPVGGTSSSAPMWAGFFARVNQARWEKGKEIFNLSGDEKLLKRFNFNLGLVHPRLYRKIEEKGKMGFQDVHFGHNLYPGLKKHQKYVARPKKWDCCSGFGRPDGEQLMKYLMEDLVCFSLEHKGIEVLGKKIKNPASLKKFLLQEENSSENGNSLISKELSESASRLHDYIATKVFLQVHDPDKDLIPTAYANDIIKKNALIAMGIGLIPLPLVDLAAITGVQIKMVRDLADLYELEFRPDRTRAIIASLLGSTGAFALGVPMVSSLAKFIPVLGGIIGAGSLSLSAGAVTYAVGKVFSSHFAYGGTFLNFNPNYAFDVFKEEQNKGKSILGKFMKKNFPAS